MSEFNPDKLIAEAKKAKSAEELLAMAKAHDIALSQEEAKEYFEQFNKTGELADDELDNVVGGGCKTNVNGRKRTVVTAAQSCFTGKFEDVYIISPAPDGRGNVYTSKIGRFSDLRSMWIGYASIENKCARCMNLEFKGGIGYCKVS